MAQRIVQHIRRHLAAPHDGRTSDRDLLARFVAGRDEEAFAALVRRHGALVLGVVRRLARDAHLAEDVFQATFLVLARQAASIRRPGSVGSWLFGVARRLALQARARAAPDRLPREDLAAPPNDPQVQAAWRELGAVLDEELTALPERYRGPLLLCFWQGRTQDEAARDLGWSKSTLRRRLEEGRRQLGLRLERRGVALPAGLLAALFSNQAATAALAPGLASAATEAALRFAWGAPAVGLPASTVALAEGVVRAMALTRLKKVVALALLLGVLGAGAGLAAQRILSEQPVTPQPTNPQPAAETIGPLSRRESPTTFTATHCRRGPSRAWGRCGCGTAEASPRWSSHRTARR